ncbi:MAG: type II CAAX endopeptidase family protein [Anaerolineales bacterium]
MTPPERSFFENIFLSPAEARLRAGWRLIIQTILMLIVMAGLGILASLFVFIFHWGTSGSLLFILNTLIEFIAITASIYPARRILDRRSFASLGFKFGRLVLPDLLAGIAITMVMMGLIYLAMSLLGWIQFGGFAWQFDSLPVVLGQILLFLLLFIVVGWQEELLSRGYHLQTLASGINLFWGVLISSAIFGILHLGNPNATWASAVGIFFAGLFLALGYLRTGQLWLSIGLHIGWNFCEGVIFGFPVSGMIAYPLLHIHVSGPEIWTGGAFGPEAGLIILPAIAIGVLLINLYSKLRSPSTYTL